MNAKVSRVHVGPYITDHCPCRETIVNRIKAEVEATAAPHPCKADNSFA